MRFFLHLFSKSASKKKETRQKARSRIGFDTLEDRTLLSANVISGFVYHDVNNNGIKDPGEAPIANSNLQLLNANNVVIATATSDANGYYEFLYDSTISSTPQTLTKTVVFDKEQTNWNKNGLLDQFDTSLGELVGVELIYQGSITSEIQVENTSNKSLSNIKATIGGNIKLTGAGVDATLNLNDIIGTFLATQYDGSLDFSGSSGNSFAPKTVNASKTINLTGLAMDPFKGTGQLQLNASAEATSTATGGGNLLVSVFSEAEAVVTVKYTYKPSNFLKPGNYTIVQNPQPAGYTDGKESANGVVLNTPPGSDSIPVTLVNTSVPNNNFGELKAASLSGYVYHDVNNNGTKDPGESGIVGVTVQLTQLTDLGPLTQEITTDANGFYQFNNLVPGNYLLKEVQPQSYLDGKDSVGSQGGTTGNDQFSNIVIASGTQGINNNFGEVLPASIGGFVYHDANDNGFFDAGEQAIIGATVTLTGFDDQGTPVSQITSSDPTGAYLFSNLRPGTYTVTETQPPNYQDGKDTLGNAGGTMSNDQFSNIVLLSGTQARFYNFGEFQGASLSGYVYLDKNNNGIKEQDETGIANATVTLTGTDSQGPVSKTTTTDAAGFYQFGSLRPGTYTVTETQPNGYKDGKDSIGSAGGVVNNDQFTSIVLAAAQTGINYNFGELPSEADLAIVKTATPGTVLIGGTINYTLTITNNGDNTAEQVVVKDTLPTNVTYVSAFAPGWNISQSGGVVTATLPSLAKGLTQTILITVTAPQATGTLVNTATVSTTTVETRYDNNTSEARVEVISNPGDPFPRTVTPLSPALVQGVVVHAGKAGMVTFRKPVPPNLQAAYNFVQNTYLSLTGKAPDPNSLMNYANQIDQGQLSRAQLVDILWNSDAHRALQADSFYQIFYNRVPTAAEKASLIQQLKAGANEYDLAVQFLTSNEYLAAHTSANALAVGLFQDVLGQNPSTANLNATLQAMDNQPWEQVVKATLVSSDALSLMVDLAFRTTVRRPATSAEINQYSPQVAAQGNAAANLVKSLLSGQEFWNLMFTI